MFHVEEKSMINAQHCTSVPKALMTKHFIPLKMYPDSAVKRQHSRKNAERTISGLPSVRALC